MSIQIMTKDGWKPVGDKESIPSIDKVVDYNSAVRHVRERMFCGWSPTPLGPMSNENLHDFNVHVQEKALALCESLGLANPNRVAREGIPL